MNASTPQQWYTVEQAARLLFREPKTVMNLLSKHQLPRRKIRGPGRSHRRIVIISYETLERLRRLTWCVATLAAATVTAPSL